MCCILELWKGKRKSTPPSNLFIGFIGKSPTDYKGYLFFLFCFLPFGVISQADTSCIQTSTSAKSEAFPIGANYISSVFGCCQPLPISLSALVCSGPVLWGEQYLEAVCFPILCSLISLYNAAFHRLFSGQPYKTFWNSWDTTFSILHAGLNMWSVYTGKWITLLVSRCVHLWFEYPFI